VNECPSCGEQNPASARFCQACGAGLAVGAARETRKLVSVLFADVTGSTALGERLDPESLRHVMAHYFEVARTVVERHGGTVEKFIGDAVMAVFGVPAMHEDDALRAVRAAAELRRSVAVLNEDLERRYGVSLELRTGVNTGEVVTGTAERLATGDAVNVAARLEQAAAPGEILIGEQTLRLARAAVRTEPVEPLSLKGKADAVPAHRLLHVVEGAPAFDRQLDARLVGRANELARLRRAFEAAVAERRCRLVTVVGPPGIGKSRLARELEPALAGEATVLTGRCLAYGDGITYWPLIEIFRQAGGEDELAASLSADAAEDISWSVRKAFERRARERPLALVVDDIHWAEPTLLDLLDHVAEWTRDAPVLMICTARPELRDERPGWGGELITLEPLSEGHADELIGARLRGTSLHGATRARIREVADGNPLFVEQLLAMVAEGGDPRHVPPTIQALLAARLDALPPEERDVVERASVVGLQFEWEALGELAANGHRPAGARLAALVRKELIRPHELIEDLFEFRHMLIRDAAYARLPKDLRAELHERFADWVDGRSEELEEIVGYHLEQAHRCVTDLGPENDRTRLLAERAATRLAASGVRADGRGDARAAVNLLERAASLLPADAPSRLQILPRLGRALREAAQMERAESVLEEAVRRGNAAGDRALAANAAVALIELRFQAAIVDRAEVVRVIERATEVFRQTGDEGGLARALTLAGKLRFWGGEAAASVAELEQAAAHARNAGDSAIEAESLQYECTALALGPTPVVDALAQIGRIQSRARGNARLEMGVLYEQARLEAMRGRFAAARGALAEAGALAADHGFEVLGTGRVALAVSFVELLSGDPVTAERVVRPACESLEAAGELGHLASAVPVLLDALCELGRDEEALALADRWRPERLTVPEDVDAQVAWRRVCAMLVARRGDVKEGERLALEAVALAASTDYLDLRADASAALGEVLHHAGRAQESAAAYEEAIRLCDQKGNTAEARRLRRRVADLRLRV
jgi:class 3 adenylate cyclase/tetratricopeptide (TPR) repeat protein